MAKILVGIVMGSGSDMPVMNEAKTILDQLSVPSEIKVISAHRTPDLAREYAKSAEERGLEVIIAGAGMAAHLAGAMAAHSALPVVGVPIKTADFGGLDALLSIVQMPKGVPVASVGIDNARNAAILAAQILSLKYPSVKKKLKEFKEKIAKPVSSERRRVEK